MNKFHREKLLTSIYMYGSIRYRQGIESCHLSSPARKKMGILEKRALDSVDRIKLAIDHMEWQTIHDTEIDNGR